MSRPASPRSFITKTAIIRNSAGWGGYVALLLAAPLLAGHLPAGVLFVLLGAIVGVIVFCAFGVVTEAEHLAHRMGDPYGTIVLTLSIVVIEVVLISAVMLGPGEHSTIARDSVIAATMIVLNLVIGLALLVAAAKHRSLQANQTGTSVYLSMLVALVSVAFALPVFIGRNGTFAASQAVPILVLTVIFYGFFLYRQTGAQAPDFREVSDQPPAHPFRTPQTSVRVTLREHRAEIITRIGVLLFTVAPIVLLSHDMATLLDDGLDRLTAPPALSGVLVAVVVFLPEAIATLRAAKKGEMQRVSNLAHGALVSCVSLTLPAVLAIGLLTNQPVVLGASPANLLLLGVSLVLTLVTYTARRITMIHGATHVLVFCLYAITLFSI